MAKEKLSAGNSEGGAEKLERGRRCDEEEAASNDSRQVNSFSEFL